MQPWTALTALGLLLAGLATRIVNLDAYTGKFDEGIRLSQLLLMTAGYRPVRDIYAAQGPLSLDIFLPWFLVLGQSLAAARAAVVAYSIFGLLAVWWTARLVAGGLAANLALLLLSLSPLYLKNSRLALLEVPSMALATVALGAALAYQSNARPRWLLLSAAAFAAAILVKPMALAVAAPILLALLLRPGRGLTDLVRFGALAALLMVAVVALYGPEQLWQQLFTYRVAAREASDWSLRENWSILRQELRDEQWAVYWLGLAGALYLAWRFPRWGLPLAVWPLASFGLLLVYAPLQFKHAAILLPPLMLVLGVSAGLVLPSAARAARSLRYRRLDRASTALVAIPLLGWYLASLPGVLRQDWQVISATTESRVEEYADEARLIQRLTGPDQFVIVDEPIVAFNSGRLIPPALVDPSSYRIESGALSGAEAVEAAERFDVGVLFLFSDGLRELERFDRLVDQRYRAVRIYERQNGKDRAILLRDDADLRTARAIVTEATPNEVSADFGGDLRLLGYNLERTDLRRGASTSLTLHWEAIRPMSVDYRVLTLLRAPDGEVAHQTERSLGGGGEGTSAWEAGRWVVRTQTLTLPARLRPGEYRLSVGLYDSRARTSPPVSAGPNAGAEDTPLATLVVR